MFLASIFCNSWKLMFMVFPDSLTLSYFLVLPEDKVVCDRKHEVAKFPQESL